jgi:hypothetical protein
VFLYTEGYMFILGNKEGARRSIALAASLPAKALSLKAFHIAPLNHAEN